MSYRLPSCNSVSSSSGDDGGKKKSNKLTPLTEVDNVNTFLVDKILDRKLDGFGKPLYLIRWLGYKEDADTWEPTENIPEVFVARYENMFELNRGKPGIKTILDIQETTKFTSSKTSKNIPKESENIFGIIRTIPEDKKLDKILGIACVEDELIFLVIFEDENEPNMVFNSAIKSAFPQKLLDFYKSKIEFVNENKLGECNSNLDDLAMKAADVQIEFSKLKIEINQDDDDDDDDDYVFQDAEDGSEPNVKLDQYGLPMLGDGYFDDIILSSDSD